MCKPTERKRIVINGAGPAGLLMASLLLARNKEPTPSVVYEVTLIDGRPDFGSFSKEELSDKHRSWMLALADHGLDAIRTLPTLYNDYVEGEGVRLTEFHMYLGKKKIIAGNADDISSGPQESLVVDRNFVVAALARYLNDTHKNDENFTSMYSTKCQYVDYENKKVLVRDVGSKAEHYIPYDLLIGCDGVRSTVREALIKRHSNFSCEITDIFSDFKQVHVDLPNNLSGMGLTLLPEIFPGAQGIALPETGRKLNIGIGFPRNFHNQIPKELHSDDFEVVAEYVKKNFKAFELVDYDDFAKQWVAQRWNQTGMVHCNFYHSVQTSIVIMGDAAHATSPSIGMGMNTALRDAQIFHKILVECKDNLDEALPIFSKERVKEGNALSDLAFHLYCLDNKQQLKEIIHMSIRSKLHSMFPRIVEDHPQSMIGRRGVPLSEVYERAVKQGIIRKHRAINDKIRLEHFEKASGMINETTTTSNLFKLIGAATSVALAAIFYQKYVNV